MTRTVLLASFLCVTIGCSNGGNEPAAQDNQPKPVATVATNAKVRVVESDGEFAKVETAEGKELYVPKARLQERNSLDRSDEEYTHVLAASTEAYAERPTAPPAPKPRSTKEIAMEQLNVNQLYLSEKTKTEVIAPARFMAPWHEELGERCFPALTCENPDCPGQGSGDRPYLFIVPFKPSGGGELICPACAEQFDSSSWTEPELIQYRKWVKPFRLPEQAARLQQLDDELKASARARRSSPHRDVTQDVSAD